MQFKFVIENMNEMKKYLFQQLVACCSERQRLSNDLSATSIQNALNNGKIEALRAALLNMGVEQKDLDTIEKPFGFKKLAVVPDDTSVYPDLDDIEFLQNQLSYNPSTSGLQQSMNEYYGPEYTENGRNIWG